MEQDDIQTDDTDAFSLRAVGAANVVRWLQIQMIEDFHRDGCERGGDNEDQQNEEQRRVHRSGPVLHDDVPDDRQDEAERENDSDAGRQVVATAPRLKPFACLSV